MKFTPMPRNGRARARPELAHEVEPALDPFRSSHRCWLLFGPRFRAQRLSALNVKPHARLDDPLAGPHLKHMASETNSLKTLAMGGLAVVAIVIAIVVAVKTFSDPSVDTVKPPTEQITGTWTRKAGVDASEPPPGAPAEYMIAKDVASFDASNAAGATGSVKLMFTDGTSTDAKVMNAQPGHLLLQVQTKGGKVTQLTIAQMGDGGPTIVTDGISNLQFEQTN